MVHDVRVCPVFSLPFSLRTLTSAINPQRNSFFLHFFFLLFIRGGVVEVEAGRRYRTRGSRLLEFAYSLHHHYNSLGSHSNLNYM